MRTTEAIKRLEKLFPGAKRENIDIGKIVRRCENEKQAVKKLLSMGYG